MTSAVRRIAIATIGAAICSATCVFGAIAPAMAATPATVAAWQDQVEDRLDGELSDQGALFPSMVRRQAEVAVRFDAAGALAGADLARSSGSKVLDERAVALAGHLAYPPLPAAWRGRPQRVAVRFVFGGAVAGPRPLEVARAAPATADSGVAIAAR